MSQKLSHVMKLLLNNTVFEHWFSPMERALQKVRYPDKAYKSLPVKSFIMLGCLRQLMAFDTLREQLQPLFHLYDNTSTVPVARSTWSDALTSNKRLGFLRQAMQQLMTLNRHHLPDRYAGIAELKNHPIYALDVTYQTESTHFNPIYPSDGGIDNQKGHLLLHTYDMRRAMPVDVDVDTQFIGEMRFFVKERWASAHWTQQANAIYVVDRAFVDFYYWDVGKQQHRATIITRMKKAYAYDVVTIRTIAPLKANEGVLADLEITPRSSKQSWRLIRFKVPNGTN